jgi:hypothetical protein
MAKHIIGTDGPPCPRCGRATEVCEHREITDRELRRPFYYARWYNCPHTDCQTTLIMPPEHKVWNNKPEPKPVNADPPWDIGTVQSGPPPWDE